MAWYLTRLRRRVYALLRWVFVPAGGLLWLSATVGGHGNDTH